MFNGPYNLESTEWDLSSFLKKRKQLPERDDADEPERATKAKGGPRAGGARGAAAAGGR